MLVRRRMLSTAAVHKKHAETLGCSNQQFHGTDRGCIDDHEPRVANHVETTVGARFNLADLPGHLSRVAQLICCTHDGQKQYGARPARVCGQEHCEKNCHEADAPHHVPRQQKTARRFCALIPDSADELQRQK